MDKGCFKMLLNILFSAIEDKTPFENKVDFEKKISKPEESVFSTKVDLSKEEDNNGEN